MILWRTMYPTDEELTSYAAIHTIDGVIDPLLRNRSMSAKAFSWT